MAIQNSSGSSNVEFEHLLADLFRRAGWRVKRQRTGGGLRPDLIIVGGRKKYVVLVKSSSEGRRDRLIPLLSQAILEAQAVAHRSARAWCASRCCGGPARSGSRWPTK